LKLATKLNVKKEAEVVVVNHAYSHFRVLVHAFKCRAKLVPKNKNLKWVKIGELDDFPMGKVDRQIAKKL
jgi:adenine-specific DNA glycosylase